MSSLRKASLRDLATSAYELEAGVLEGQLHRDKKGGEWMVGNTTLSSWLDRYAEQEVYLIVASLDDERPIPPKVCRTCATEYVGAECPRCRMARIRLRG
jgi:hypothetical protein